MHAIVVTHAGAAWLPDCLRALAAQEACARLELVVVDNGSSDGTSALLRNEFPSVAVLRLPENQGYARGNNAGLRRALAAGADFAALVNDDVEVEPGWLQALLDAAAAHPEAGLFCGTLLFRGEERVNSTGVVLDAFGRARDRDFGQRRSAVVREDGPVAGVTGGAALIRTALLRRTGLFDPGYFAYYEDVDLSLRAAREGSLCWYAARAVATGSAPRSGPARPGSGSCSAAGTCARWPCTKRRCGRRPWCRSPPPTVWRSRRRSSSCAAVQPRHGPSCAPPSRARPRRSGRSRCARARSLRAPSREAHR